MTEQDFTQIMRDIDSLQERLDKVFKRVNADPIYADEKQIGDAISDNPRYFAMDRKNELCEIFFAILDQIYARIVNQDRENYIFNPQLPPGPGVSRLPEMDMLERDMMPLSWALQAEWAAPYLCDTIDSYFQLFSEAEAEIVFDTVDFLFRIFPEYAETPQGNDVLEYWRKLAHERDSLRPESDEDKSFLLDLLMKKKQELTEKKQNNDA